MIALDILRRHAMGLLPHAGDQCPGQCIMIDGINGRVERGLPNPPESRDPECEVCSALDAPGALMNALASASARHVEAKAAFDNYHGPRLSEKGRLGDLMVEALKRKHEAAAALEAAQ